jgi:WD40 repeat protein
MRRLVEVALTNGATISAAFKSREASVASQRVAARLIRYVHVCNHDPGHPLLRLLHDWHPSCSSNGLCTVRCAALSDVQAVATASGDKTLRLWSLVDGSCLRTLEGHTASVLRCSFLTSGTQARHYLILPTSLSQPWPECCFRILAQDQCEP